MPAERLPMRKIREVLRLKYVCGASDRVISRSVGIGRTAIAEYVRRAAVIGISWPIPEDLDDTALERKLFAPAGYNPPRSKPLPDWGHVHAELRRRGVTLALLWEEYRGHHPDGYGYSRFCDLYVEWRHGITATMRQTHTAGEKLFVDFAGDTVPVFDGLAGEVRATKIFVAVMGASNIRPSSVQRGAARLDRRPCRCAYLPGWGAEGARLRQSEGRGDDGEPL
jgi:transposase